jgi:hypothetical protein
MLLSFPQTLDCWLANRSSVRDAAVFRLKCELAGGHYADYIDCWAGLVINGIGLVT